MNVHHHECVVDACEAEGAGGDCCGAAAQCEPVAAQESASLGTDRFSRFSPFSPSGFARGALEIWVGCACWSGV